MHFDFGNAVLTVVMFVYLVPLGYACLAKGLSVMINRSDPASIPDVPGEVLVFGMIMLGTLIPGIVAFNTVLGQGTPKIMRAAAILCPPFAVFRGIITLLRKSPAAP